MNASETRDIIFRVTREQLLAIEAFYNHNDWNFNDSIINNPWEETESQELICVGCVPEMTSSQNSDNNENSHRNGDQNIEEGFQNIREHGQINGDECLHCFCSPCVTNDRQQWLGQGAPKHVRNSGIRKERYKKFWTLLSRKGAWLDSRYLTKKSALMGRNDTQESCSVWTKRELMPDCVLNLVRELYPNPDNRPYMGHKWV